MLLGLVGCTESQQTNCNCQVEGVDYVRTVRNLDGVELIQSSLPVFIEPYDTLINCDLHGYSWETVTTTPLPDGTITSTKERRINCN